jgi:enediyne biosynthesis protein E4
MTRELTIGGGHAGGILGWWHFGLGDAADARVTVTWPDGATDEWTGLTANELYVLERDKPAARFVLGQAER